MSYQTMKNEAIKTAYQKFYGLPYGQSKNKTTSPKPRMHHGIMHGCGCMDLISTINCFYQKHVVAYTSHMEQMAHFFKLSPEDLITLIEITALFHDTGRKNDGIDLWDKDSGENLFAFLTQHNVPTPLAHILQYAIQYKDAPSEYKAHAAALIPNGLSKAQLDYIRQLLNMADVLEIIRERKIFICRYLPIQFSDKPTHNFKQTKEMFFHDLNIMIRAAAQRIDDEYRASPRQTKIELLDHSPSKPHFFLIHHKNASNLAAHQKYFDTVYLDKYPFLADEKKFPAPERAEPTAGGRGGPSVSFFDMDEATETSSFRFKCFSAFGIIGGLALLIAAISMTWATPVLVGGCALLAFGVLCGLFAYHQNDTSAVDEPVMTPTP
jgi:hypothetical protein